MEAARRVHLHLAKLAEQAERFSDMWDEMVKLSQLDGVGGKLTEEERNMLASSFKNAVGTGRAAWRVFTSAKKEEEKRDDKDAAYLAGIATYLESVGKEVVGVCDRAIGLLDASVLPSVAENDVKVFFLKMKGDSLRYKVEVATPTEREAWAGQAQQAYSAAVEIATQHLAPDDPVRLGLGLNFSVFYYEIANEPQKAIQLARETFEGAISQGTMGDNYKDATLILQLLRDNLTLWTGAEDDDDDGGDSAEKDD
jgi:hypothetical protein